MEPWERQLRRAWKAASSNGIDSSLFAKRAKQISAECVGGKLPPIFKQSGHASKFTKSSLPTESDVLTFYNSVIKQQAGVLKVILADVASSSHMDGKSKEYCTLLARLAYFAKKTLPSIRQQGAGKTMQMVSFAEPAHRECKPNA